MAEQHARQMWGSLIAALLLVTGVVLLVAWRIGPDGVPSRAREEAIEERAEAAEEAAEAEDPERGRGRRGRNRD